jgi:hypothetical protein
MKNTGACKRKGCIGLVALAESFTKGSCIVGACKPSCTSKV